MQDMISVLLVYSVQWFGSQLHIGPFTISMYLYITLIKICYLKP